MSVRWKYSALRARLCLSKTRQSRDGQFCSIAFVFGYEKYTDRDPPLTFLRDMGNKGPGFVRLKRTGVIRSQAYRVRTGREQSRG